MPRGQSVFQYWLWVVNSSLIPRPRYDGIFGLGRISCCWRWQIPQVCLLKRSFKQQNNCLHKMHWQKFQHSATGWPERCLIISQRKLTACLGTRLAMFNSYSLWILIRSQERSRLMSQFSQISNKNIQAHLLLNRRLFITIIHIIMITERKLDILP